MAYAWAARLENQRYLGREHRLFPQEGTQNMNYSETKFTMPVLAVGTADPVVCRIGMKIANTNRKVKFCLTLKENTSDTEWKSWTPHLPKQILRPAAANPIECRIPDGVAVDIKAGHIYWTNMGIPGKNDGSIERAELDGQNRKTIVTEGWRVHTEATTSW